jgi:hypothetical protein
MTFWYAVLLKVSWLLPLFLVILSFSVSYSYNHIHTDIQPSPFIEASLHFFTACSLRGKKPPCGAKPRFKLGSAIQQASTLPTDLRCTLPTELRCTLPTELCCTLLSTLHPAELSWTLHPTEIRCTLLSYAAPFWATLQPAELHCTLLSYAAPYWATQNPAELRCTLMSYAAP